MFRLYFSLYFALAVCLGVSAWLLETKVQSNQSLSALEYSTISRLFGPAENTADTQASFSLTKNLLQQFHWSQDLLSRMKNKEIIMLHDDQNSIYFYKLANDKQHVLTLGPFPQHSPTNDDSFISLLFYTATAFAVFICSWPLFNDLHKLRRASEKISQGDFNQQTQFTRFSMIKSIGDAFDQMSHKLNQRTNTQRELINAVSHDFLTPISRAKFALETANERTDVMLLRDSVLQDTIELELLVDEFLTYAELSQCQPHFIPRQENALELLEICAHKFAAYSPIVIHLDCHCRQIKIDKRSFIRIIQNLLGNAIRFANSQVNVSLKALNQGLILAIEDDGPGISAELLPALLKPFAKKQQISEQRYQGVGLGLAIVKQLCAWQDAQLSFSRSEALSGAKITIIFQ
ncbi:ATP-binding protein [Thalassotalea sp. ND16A]|uniref:ATP-binding protein n=1 Tax=Thalassotalea sp. ND16A TaxID=1535422 RepID=UPI00051A7497|nr:ATP-binding protein [Thalassotalea sp. ND16A]KGJ87857.1 hypothetical protein ND16A_2771 [Thalassotalea sp. ND16A]